MTQQREYTGGSVSYYKVRITAPTSGGDPYTAECNDIIEALGMNYAEGNAFKAIWRSCAARNLNLCKYGYKDGLYDAEKVEFFGKRMVSMAKTANHDITIQSVIDQHNDGWIEWKGVGDPTIQRDCVVEYKLRLGVVSKARASQLWWKHNDETSDIIAYRIVK